MNTNKPTLKEMLAQQKNLPAMDLGPVKKLFGDDAMPDGIDESQAGRVKLHQALSGKFGPQYMSHPGVKPALDHYEKESDFLKLYKRTLGARHG